MKGHQGNDNPKWHIGKRSAAGLYCWDCGVTLCKSGNRGVHQGQSEWYEACPKCGQKPKVEDLATGAMGRELGFNTQPFQKKTGVQSCASFFWARKLGKVQNIVNEYGDSYTREEFLQLLEECPIQHENMIGALFS